MCVSGATFRCCHDNTITITRVRVSGPDHHVRTSPTFTHTPQASTPTDVYCHVGPRPQGPLYVAPGNPRAFDCPSIHITSIAGGVSRGAPAEASWCREHLFLPLDAGLRDPALAPSPGSSLSSRSWMSDLSSCESFSHIYDDVEVELSAAARLALGSPGGSPGCGGGAFGVELWQQKYQHPAAFSPSLSPLQSPTHSPRGSVTEDNWLSRPASRSPWLPESDHCLVFPVPVGLQRLVCPQAVVQTHVPLRQETLLRRRPPRVLLLPPPLPHHDSRCVTAGQRDRRHVGRETCWVPGAPAGVLLPGP